MHIFQKIYFWRQIQFHVAHQNKQFITDNKQSERALLHWELDLDNQNPKLLLRSLDRISSNSHERNN